MDEIDKVKILFEYLSELSILKNKTITNVDSQRWNLFLDDIPKDEENIKMFSRDIFENYTEEDATLLSVKKPNFKKCPPPPESLEKWIKNGWNDYKEINIIKEKIEIKSVNNGFDKNIKYEYITDSKERELLTASWVSKRNNWIAEQKKIKATRDLFSNLFMANTLIERESESYEFMVGNGVIKTTNNKDINHPILLKRVMFNFNANTNTIKIIDTDSDSILYSSLLKDIEDINHGRLQPLQEILTREFLHPLDNHETKDFLKQLTNQLSDKSRFIEKNENEDKKSFDDILSLKLKPVFLIRKKQDGTPEMINDIRKDLDEKGYIDGYFSDLVGGKRVEKKVVEELHEMTIDESLAATSGENIDILLAKEANSEQLQIAQRIENHNAVVVQGPPGTGKTHTIANLLGHFLSQGKTVLVTSHTTKALSVLKSHIPPSIQDLCVTVLGDSNEDMVSSVDGITNKISEETSKSLERQIFTTEKEREEIIRELSDVRRKIYTIKNKEFKPIVYEGDSYSPAEIAKFVNDNKRELDFIPGYVEKNKPLPVSLKELITLYQSNANLTSWDEKELSFSIPNPENLISIENFNNYLQVENIASNEMDEIREKLGLDIYFDLDNSKIITKNSKYKNSINILSNPSIEAIDNAQKYLASFDMMDDWMIQAAVDGRRGAGHKEKWKMLVDSIEDTYNYAESIVTDMLGYIVVFQDTTNLSEMKIQLNKLYEIYANKGKVSKIDFFFNRNLESTIKNISVNNHEINSLKDCEVALYEVNLLLLSKKSEKYWDPLMKDNKTPSYTDFGNKPWEFAKRRISMIKKYVNWYETEYKHLLDLLNDLGINQEFIFDFEEFDDDLIRTSKILKTIANILPYYIKAAQIMLELKNIKNIREKAIIELSKEERRESEICNKTINAIKNKDKQQYRDSIYRLESLYNKYALQENRFEILSRLSQVAPDWANAIRKRHGIHGQTLCPENILEAWKWKQFEEIIKEIINEPLEVLQKKSLNLSSNLRKKTEQLVSEKSWYHLILRTEKDVSLKQNLTGWKITVQKIGKGYGKRTAMLRREARNKMEKSQLAVPAWIMPMSSVSRSFKVSDNLFDVLIVDEASQSDITSLATLYLAKKVIVVGDNKQVSPLAVGSSISKIDNLRNSFIRNKIPNWDLYDATTSLYDIAGTTFNPIMLKEHFRCVPEIIGYSNRLSYDYEIKPLRDAKSSHLSPAVVSYRTKNGKRSPGGKTNIEEANQVVALIMACIEQPEYNKQTFGVISLLGSEQAELIERKIIDLLPISEFKERKILCGDASNFQGDERDVVFISLVDSNESSGPLRLRGYGRQDSIKQRYNVAASRAKNQLWVVHSLDHTRDLKTGDLRKGLIEYALNPYEYRNIEEQIIKKSDSPFEEEVAKKLVSAGYNISQQWPVGSYRLDMVAQYKGEKVVIECDGEQWHSGEKKVREDMERQTILERLGWRFIRLRGSEYYLDKEAAIKRVIQDLQSFGIKPESMIKNTNEESSELLSKIKMRAKQILDSDFENNNFRVKTNNDSRSNININKAKKNNETKFSKHQSNVNKKVEINIENQYLNTIKDDNIKENNLPKDNNRSNTPVNFHSKASENRKKIIKEDLETKSDGNKKISDLLVANEIEEQNNNAVKKDMMKELIHLLSEKSIEYAKDRNSKNILWVRYSKEARIDFQEIYKKLGFKYTIEPRGSISSNYIASWRVVLD